MDTKEKFWIGLIDRQKEGTFVWESGRQLSDEIVAHWWRDGRFSEPDNYLGDEDCAHVAGSYMYDSQCSKDTYRGIWRQNIQLYIGQQDIL